MYEMYQDVVKYIVENRTEVDEEKCIFDNIRDALLQIEEDFCSIKELADVCNLETSNSMHHESVSDHTKTVVNKLSSTQYYCYLGGRERAIVKLAAYFHDIGKGPREKWKGGVQTAYADHPRDALPMLARIFTEDFRSISYEDYRQICLLVAYHDLLGDIIGKGRSRIELEELRLSDKELYMLATLSEADICAIGGIFALSIKQEICNLVNLMMR